MTETTADGDVLKFISHSIGGMMLVVDVVTVLGLGFDYVAPVLLALPEIEPTQTLSAIVVLTFLVFMQVLFLPLIVFLFEFPSNEP